MSSVLALIAALVFGAADFSGGHATRRMPVATVTLISNLFGFGCAVVLAVLLGGHMTTRGALWGAAAGACGLVGLLFLYSGLASGPNRLVSPMSAVISAAIPVVFGFSLGNRPSALAIVGLVLTPPAIWLVSGGDLRLEGASRRPLTLATGAGIGFGLFFVCLAQTPDGAGAMPLLATKATSSLLLIAYNVALARSPKALTEGRHPFRSARISMLLPAMAGVLDMTANGLFLWSTRSGDLAVVGALVSLFPVTTILLAVTVLGERLTKPQTAGLVLAVSAAALLS